jgi:hypothetical protein
MLAAIHVDGPELPSKGRTYAHRQIQLESLRAVCAYFREVCSDTTEPTDGCDRCQLTEPRIDEPECTRSLAGTVGAEQSGLDNLGTDMERKAESRIELRDDAGRVS